MSNRLYALLGVAPDALGEGVSLRELIERTDRKAQSRFQRIRRIAER